MRKTPLHPVAPTSGPARRLLLGRSAAISAVALCGLAFSALPAGASGGSVSLVAYSTPKPAYSALAAAFAKTKAGAGITVSSSFGPSGTQATSVVNGLPADLLNFSLTPDMTQVVKAGLVASSLDRTPTKGMVTNSIVSFIVRPGNPKHITTWADLIKPGVKVITPNVFSSGSAKWNLMAAYGAQLSLGKSTAQAQLYLSNLLKNAVAQPASASAALQTFLSGQGDVLLDYEDDRLYAKSQAEPGSVVTPPQTILIQNPIAGTKTASPPAKAFLPYLPPPPRRPDGLGQAGLPPRAPLGGRQVQLPQAQDAVHHRQGRRVDGGQHEVL